MNETPTEPTRPSPGAPASTETEAADRPTTGGTPAPGTRPPRVLVVSYLFPPDGSVGGLRWAGIAKYLARDGWRIQVLAGGEAERPDAVEGVPVRTVRRVATLNDLYRRLSKGGGNGKGGGGGGASPSAGAGDVRPKDSLLQKARRTLAASLRFPDYSRGWALKASREVRRIIIRDRIDVVVSSGPPHPAHLAAMLGTRRTGVRWLIDMRDPWLEMVDEPSEIFHWVARHLESAAFSRADAIICNTRQFADDLRRRRPDALVHWVPNGIDLEALPAPVPASAGPLTLAYVGTLYFNRDLGPVIRAMQAYRAACPDGRGIRLRFAGHADPEHAAALERQMREAGLGAELVERLGLVPQARAREVVQESHLAVVLAQGQPLQVPAKLYESMGMGVQTLVLSEPGTAAASEAERIGALWREPSDVEGICALLVDMAEGRIPLRPDPAERFDYRHVADRVAGLLSAERA